MTVYRVLQVLLCNVHTYGHVNRVTGVTGTTVFNDSNLKVYLQPFLSNGFGKTTILRTKQKLGENNPLFPLFRRLQFGRKTKISQPQLHVLVDKEVAWKMNKDTHPVSILNGAL